MRTSFTYLAVTVWFLGSLGEAHADVLFSSGPINGTKNAYGIYANHFSDSFVLPVEADLTEVHVGLWVRLGDTPKSVQWSIGSKPFGSDVDAGTASVKNGSLTNTFHNSANLGGAGDWIVYSSSFPVHAHVGTGTYWLSLTKGFSEAGDSLYWDLNFSSATTTYTSSTGSSNPPYARDEGPSFDILGTPAVSTPVVGTPEPSSLAMLLAGAVSLAGCFARRSVRGRWGATKLVVPK